MKNEVSTMPFRHQTECFVIPPRENNEAFENLYRQYWPQLVHFAGHYIDDKQTCEEIVQDLFVQLYVRGISVKLKQTLTSYLFVALRNRIFNHFRNKAVYKKHVTIAGNRRVVPQNNVEQSIDLKDLQNSISASLRQMPARCSEVFLLRQEQLTVKQISQALNRPTDTVEKQLRKAKKMLIEQLVSTENTFCSNTLKKAS